MNRILSTLLLCILISASVCAQQKTFKNPVIQGDVADPSMIRIGDTYYATGTSSEWAPFYPVFISKDLVNWKQTGHIFNKQPEWTVSSFWAPELYHHKNGMVYCYYTARRKSDNISYIGVATAKSPTDEFTDHGVIIEYGTEAIDAFVYDDNGQLYITWKAYGLDRRPIEIVGSKLSTDGMRLEGDVFTLLVDDENIGMEGQYHFKHGEYYHIVYAARGCCGPGSDYDVRVARSKSFKGPYEKYEHNPIMYGGNHDFMSSGHGTAITTPDGRMFYMCHAYLKGDGFFRGRQPILQEMYVGDDNWVHMRSGRITAMEQPMPFPKTIQKLPGGFKDDFKGKKLKVEWTWNYTTSDVKTELKKGKLLLSGTPKGDNPNVSVLALRPQASDYVYETRVANNNQAFKGLTMYGDAKSLLAWGTEGNRLILKSIKDGKETVLFESVLSVEKPYLHIKVQDGHRLNFYWSEDGKAWKKVNDEILDFGDLIRWDRVARPGLLHMGEENQPAEFESFSLQNIKIKML